MQPNELLVGTRKGLFVLARSPSGWCIHASAFLAEPVSMVLGLGDERWVALRLGHFGGKLHHSADAGHTWTERGVPTYPPAPEPPETDTMGRPWPWKLDQIWSLERDARGRLWAGTIPGGLFCSDDGGATWVLDRGLWDRPERKQWFGGGYDTPGIHSVALDPRDPDRMTLGVSCGGVWLTSDGGASWTLGGEGLFIATLRGPGKVYLQTMPLDKLARKIVQYMPKTGGGQSGGLNVDIGQLLRGQ